MTVDPALIDTCILLYIQAYMYLWQYKESDMHYTGTEDLIYNFVHVSN